MTVDPYPYIVRWAEENADKLSQLEDVHARLSPHNCVWHTPLQMALIAHRADMVTTLLNMGADTSDLGPTAGESLEASMLGCFDFEDIKAICYTRGEKPSCRALQHIAANGNVIHLKWLLDQGVNPNCDEANPLFAAISHGHTTCLRVLLRRGAKATAGDIAKALESADHNDALSLLLEAGTDINISDANGDTPLLCLCHGLYEEHERIGRIALLLTLGADVNAANPQGYTPLLIASAAGHHRIVNLLLANGADWRLRDREGRTALYFARLRNRTAIIERLQSLEA